MKYFLSCQDSNGYIYSIDNVVLEYIIKYKIDFIDYLHDLNKKYKLEGEYWEKLNCTMCSKYQFYSDHIHLCDGIYLMIGRYVVTSGISGSKDIFPMLKLEINPNKHAEKPIFNELLNFLLLNCGDCTLKKYDISIDIKCKLNDIQVFGSRKEKGLYKGTRYYGQRNKDGYMKIYDKGKERGLEEDLTRIEYTLVYDKGKKSKSGLNIQDVFIASGTKEEEKLNGSLLSLVKLYKLCVANGLDPEPCISNLDYRRIKQIKECINEVGYKKIEFDYKLHDELIEKIKKIFGVVENSKVFEDSQGFLRCDNLSDLPFV